MSKRNSGMSTGAKVSLWLIGIIAALAVVFVGLYFGVPGFHDWVVNLFTPEKVEEGSEVIESAVETFIKL